MVDWVSGWFIYKIATLYIEAIPSAEQLRVKSGKKNGPERNGRA